MANLVDDTTALLKDSLYVTVGLGVLAAQQIAIRTRRVAELAQGGLAGCGQVTKTVEERFEAVLDDVEERLPDPVDDAFARARELASTAADQVRATVNRLAA